VVEDPTLNLWFIGERMCFRNVSKMIDWNSYEEHLAYENAPEYKSKFIPTLAKVFDLQAGPPLKCT
jgi:hypothetical protein